MPINAAIPGGYRCAPPTLQKWQRPGNGDDRKGRAVACPGLKYNRSTIRSKAEICGMAEVSHKQTCAALTQFAQEADAPSFIEGEI